MKTKYSRLGNSAVSIVLAVLMVISSTIVGSSSSIDSIAADTPDTVSQTVAEPETAADDKTVGSISEYVETVNEDKEPEESVELTPSVKKNTKGALTIQPSGSNVVSITGTKIGTSAETVSDSEQTITFDHEATTYYISSTGVATANQSVEYIDLYIKKGAQLYFTVSGTKRSLNFNPITAASFKESRTYWWKSSAKNSETKRSFDSSDGMYRIYCQTTQKDFIFYDLNGDVSDYKLVGSGATATDTSTTLNWADAPVSFSFSEFDDYIINLNKPDANTDLVFKLNKGGNNGTWLGGTSNSISLSTVGSISKLAMTGGNNVKFTGVAGNYVLHCDGDNNVWITQATQNRTITKGTETNGTFLITDSADGTTTIQQATSGSTVYVKATPTSDSYYASGVTISGADVDVTKVDDNLFSFTMPNANIVVTANIVQKKDCTVSVTTNNASFGSVDNSTITATTGEVVTLTATPASSDYKFNGWTVTTGSGNFTTSNDLSTDSTISLCVLDDFTIQANFVSKNNVRIYFFDNENFGLPFLHCWGASSGENTEWPGIEMTPVDGYINLYYADLSESELGFTVTGMMFDNVTRSTYEQSGGGTSTQDQGSQTTGVTISGLSNYNNKVFSVSFHSKKHRKNETKRRKYDIIDARKITAWY